jgi:ribonuclease-3 family protein
VRENALESNIFSFAPSKKPNLLHPIVLAYLGDGIYEVYIRQYLLSLSNHKPHHLQKSASKLVSAKAQSKALKAWLPVLTEEELNMVKRGRNAKSGTVPKNADLLEYRHSTAFECLIGYLYLQQRYERLEELMAMALDDLLSNDRS